MANGVMAIVLCQVEMACRRTLLKLKRWKITVVLRLGMDLRLGYNRAPVETDAL